MSVCVIDVSFQVGHRSPGLYPEYTVSPPVSGCPLLSPPPYSLWGGTEKMEHHVSAQTSLRGATQEADCVEIGNKNIRLPVAFLESCSLFQSIAAKRENKTQHVFKSPGKMIKVP